MPEPTWEVKSSLGNTVDWTLGGERRTESRKVEFRHLLIELHR